MADTKISALTSGNPAQSGDEIPIARSGANYKITAGSIASLGGDVDGPASAVDSQIALFDSTTGKLIKAATTTGLLKASSGVIAAAVSSTDYAPATTGTSAQLLANSGSGGFANVTVGSNLSLSAGTLTAGLVWQSVQTTGFTAVAGRAYPCNTTSAAFTVTLPSSPSAGDQITLTDYAGTWDTNNLTINPNGGKINGDTNNGIVSTERGAVNLVYVDSTQGWISYASNLFTVIYGATPTIDYLIVAGGGAGGGHAPSDKGGGGGGAGGFRTGTGLAVTAGISYTITVGAGGSGVSNDRGGSGTNSSIAGFPIAENPSGAGTNTFKSYGGGGGGAGNNTAPGNQGANGGSGGGNGGRSLAATSGNTPSTTPSQGNGGGSTGASSDSGSGGGGASAAGGSVTTNPGGAGGAGTASSITGTSTTYAGGGGGGSYSGNGGAGGAGGGGAGGNSNATTSTAGTVNTGGGGGGAPGLTAANYAGAAGGSGIVIIAYPSIYAAASATTGSPTVTVSGGNRIYQFTGNGSITF